MSSWLKLTHELSSTLKLTHTHECPALRSKELLIFSSKTDFAVYSHGEFDSELYWERRHVYYEKNKNGMWEGWISCWAIIIMIKLNLYNLISD